MPVAIITGGAQGMGRSYSFGLARAGFSVVTVDVDTVALDRTTREAEAAGLSIMPHKMDVTDEDAVTTGFDEIIDRHGGVDVLVNNAGGARTGKRLAEMKLSEWQAELGLNLTSQFLCIRAVLPAMTRARSGSIVNIASASVSSGITAALYAGERGANLVGYVAAKGGVVAMTRTLARELGADGIRVNAVAPGFTPTDRIKRTFSKNAIARMVDDQALKRVQTPDDAVGAILFLASPQSEFVTGQVIRVDGGASMG